MVIVRFTPQAWINNYATEVDPEGEVTFRVPIADVLDANGRLVADYTYEADALKDHPNAPEWIRAWHGPFDVEIVGAAP